MGVIYQEGGYKNILASKLRLIENKIEKGGGGGGGIKIVNSETDLDPNASLGSMACVISEGESSSFRDLYQPDMSLFDQNTLLYTQPELLSRVSNITIVTPPNDFVIPETILEMLGDGVMLFPRNSPIYPPDKSIIFTLVPESAVSGLGLLYPGLVCALVSEQTIYTLIHYVNNEWVILQEDVDKINNILQSDDYCWLGSFSGSPSSEAFDILDLFILCGSQPTSSVFIKKDKWEELNKKDIEKLVNDVSNLKQNKANVITTIDTNISDLSSYKSLNVNTYYKILVNSAINKTIRLDPTEADKYSEYIMEIKCEATPTKLTIGSDIIWANDLEPEFEAGYTYLISVVNGFGVFTQFTNVV